MLSIKFYTFDVKAIVTKKVACNILWEHSQKKRNMMGICISWPSVLAPNLYLPVLAPYLYLPALVPNLYLPTLVPNLYLPTLAPNLYLPALAPNLYLPAQPGLSLHIPTLSPQFLFTGPGLWFVRTQAAKLIYPQWCWIM